MPAKVYTQKEAKITPIKKKTLAVIGYLSLIHISEPTRPY